MENRVELSVLSELSNFPLIKSAIKKSLKNSSISKTDRRKVVKATKELFENSVIHGYGETQGEIEAFITLSEYGIRIDIKDKGTPMSSKKYRSVNIDSRKIKGFNRVFLYTDKFTHKNLSRDGKLFSIYKFFKKPTKNKFSKIESRKKKSNKISRDKLVKSLVIRDFNEDDEEGIAKLIYQNYGNSYIKDMFYNPQQILDKENRGLYSVVAEIKGELVGHFSVIKLQDSNIAEIGIVVVNPEYKGLGIMNLMFVRLIEKAKELNLDAIFGEAIMYHIFSQKANLKYGFYETSFLYGKTLKNISIENNELSSIPKRGSVLIGYKFLKRQKKEIYLPEIYRDKIIEIYDSVKDEISYRVLDKSNGVKALKGSKLSYSFDHIFNISTIVINRYGEDFEKKFETLFYHLKIKHSDIINVDLNLETIPELDRVVETLNKSRFFFLGIHFLAHKEQDYIRFQYNNTEDIGAKNFVCYSEFCKKLTSFVKEDKKRVQKLSIK